MKNGVGCFELRIDNYSHALHQQITLQSALEEMQRNMLSNESCSVLFVSAVMTREPPSTIARICVQLGGPMLLWQG